MYLWRLRPGSLLGVHYHLRYLFLGLDNLWQLTRGEVRLVIENHFVLADGKVTRLQDIDRRLVETPIYRLCRFNELHPADYSNWFGGNIAAVLESLASAGLNPTLLGKWGSRGAFQAVKNPAIPREWEVTKACA